MPRDRVSKDEVLKMLNKLKSELKSVKANNDFVRNIKAYIHDTEFFLEKGDYVLAFEAIVWAWAWFEIGKEIGKI